MSLQVPLIRRSIKNDKMYYEVCKEGLGVLRKLRTKKLRLLFNITHQSQSLAKFNSWLLNQQYSQDQTVNNEAYLTVSSKWRQLQGDRAILVCTAYEKSESQPFMVLLGYLISSAFLYHHFDCQLQVNSALTLMLGKLKVLLSSTDIHELHREIKFKKGYSRNPYFLCLLSPRNGNKIDDIFKEFYKYRQDNEILSEAVDVLIDYLPERASTQLQMSQQNVAKIGKQFEQTILGREIFNFQFTGSTFQNICFQFCQKFNSNTSINLTQIYTKIIDNQKNCLQDQIFEQYITMIKHQFFGGKIIDYQGISIFPLTTSTLLQQHEQITDVIHQNALKMAANCMSLNQYSVVQSSLNIRFKQQFEQLNAANKQKAQQLCGECFTLLQNLEEGQGSADDIADMFRQTANKLELYQSQCCNLLGKDSVLQSFSSYLLRLQDILLSKLSAVTSERLSDLELKQQEHRLEVESLKYRLRLSQNQLRNLQFQYNLQGDILNQYKVKLNYEPDPINAQTYSLETNKLRKRVQELEEEVKDKTLQFEELEGILDRFQGLRDKEKSKYKFSKEILEMIKDVTIKINTCYNCLKQVKNSNDYFQNIKAGFNQQKKNIIDEKHKISVDINKKESQLQKLIKEKTILEETIEQARQSIHVYKQTAEKTGQAIQNLQSQYSQLTCDLAETQNDLELYKKALGLVSEWQKTTRSQNLRRFCQVQQNEELKQLLQTLLKK